MSEESMTIESFIEACLEFDLGSNQYSLETLQAEGLRLWGENEVFPQEFVDQYDYILTLG